MTHRSKTALFAGTFNPFTIGHKSIVERALTLCDNIVIALGVNPDKPDSDTDSRLAAIEKIFEGNKAVSVRKYSGLTVDFARECGADFIVRGVRNVTDFEYERNLADINLKISGIETVFLPALPELSYISSSMVRELSSHGVDTTPYLP